MGPRTPANSKANRRNAEKTGLGARLEIITVWGKEWVDHRNKPIEIQTRKSGGLHQGGASNREGAKDHHGKVECGKLVGYQEGLGGPSPQNPITDAR